MIFVGSYAKTSREIRYLDAGNPTGTFKVVLPRQAGHEYDVDHYNGVFYITTNKAAKNFRVVTAPIADPSEGRWKPFIDHNPAVKIDGLSFFAGHSWSRNGKAGLTFLRVIDMKTRGSHRITTNEADYALSLAGNPEFNTTTVRFTYESMVTPSSVYDYDLNTRTRTLLKQQEVLGGYDPAAYEARRIWAVARDGTKVPMSIVSKKGVTLDGRAPLLLYAYGSYGASLEPDFLVEPAQPPRSRRHLRARLHPRRRGARRGMARAGTDDAEAEHVPRLHRLRRVSRQEQVHLAGPARDSGRQRRRPARRRGRQHAPRSVQGRGRAGAVRRRHEHDARRVRCR